MIIGSFNVQEPELRPYANEFLDFFVIEIIACL